ncbi:MAG: hypothetical protein ABI857_13075 [Acidobacteriota bacterium]
MQNSNAVRTRSRTAAIPARELSWSFMLLVVICAGVVAAGFFFAARQHFTSMDFGIKNSNLREQLQNLETEKRRLILAREVALSPMAIRKAADAIGMREVTETAAVQLTNSKATTRNNSPSIELAKPVVAISRDARAVVRTVLSAPVHPKSAGETRGRIVEPSKDKKEKTEVVALLKLR